jgi:hypothetical protein
VKTIAAVLPLVLAASSAAAHHGAEDASDIRSLILWIGAALAAGVLGVLSWMSSRRRKRDPDD